MKNGRRLRETIKRPGILVLPGVYDCVSAKIAEKCGFGVLFTSGFGISATLLGKPDFGFVTATEMLESIGRIVKSVMVPVVADIDTGYGNPLNVIRTVEDAVQAGAAGIILEDQVWPKKCGHFEGKNVIALEEHVEKIFAAREAAGESGLVIIGRTDANAVNGLEDAIKRGWAYYEAGADVVFIEAPKSLEELKEIAKAFPDVPLFANMVEGGKTPILSTGELETLGFKIVVYPLTGLFSAAYAIKASLSHLREHGTTEGYGALVNFAEFEDVVDMPIYREQESKFSVPD